MKKNSFNFLRKDGDSTYTEVFGIDFEDFEVGDRFEHRPGHTFTEEEAMRHASRSLDLTPFVVDQHYSRRVYGSRLRVPETYVAAAMALTTKTLGKVVVNLSMTHFDISPVYVGDTLYFESCILQKRASQSRPQQGLIHVESKACNQLGEEVVRFERKLLIYRKGLGPYRAADY